MTPPSSAQYVELAELAGGFIHEIKNHLSTLSLNLQLLAEDFEQPETPRERKAQTRIARLTNECRRLAELSNDFLRFARMDQLHTRSVDTEAFIARMVDFLTPTARAQNIEIRWHCEPDLPPIRLDDELFEKAMLNLMLNAEDAMPDGGTMTIIARRENADFILEIIDTGCGIPEDLLPKLFTPFLTTKQNGNGLGLATCRKIVHAHAGTIEVQSALGTGTRFTIRIPFHRNDSTHETSS